MFVKICGITRPSDARFAVEHGADALGFVFWPRSPRWIDPDLAASIIDSLPAHVTAVGVFVNDSVEAIRRVVAKTQVGIVQLHGDETPSYAMSVGRPVLRAVTVDDAEAAARAWPPDTTLLMDAVDPVRRGGTGVTVDWPRAAAVARTRRIVLAGGLTPENVADAVRAVQPYGVDVSSGVEDSPGLKNEDKVKRFLEGARGARGRR
jgi:phosphoribosylanthranilate isomerase